MLLGYNFFTKYQSTDAIGHVDVLSEPIDSQRQPPADAVVAAITVGPEVNAVLATTTRVLPVTSAMVRDTTGRDPHTLACSMFR
ncbi:hypothetical protein CSKR_201039 [Clonorchis sinensis]|uniref:Uncharacterized protein n=1 Tax=Clonorchis sinensis TaxID=79923 RepID=A0A8T1MK45_CLOSI|nr:hypothetical protein CSKR_201039 [Clonorchis sinensis]